MVMEEDQLNFCFQVIENKIIWVNFEQRTIWHFDLPLQDLLLEENEESKDDLAGKNTKFKISWHLYECKSFLANSLFKGVTTDEFDEQQISIHEVDEISPIRKRRLGESNDEK